MEGEGGQRRGDGRIKKVLTIKLPQHTVHSSRAPSTRHADVELVSVLGALSLCLHRRSDSGCCVSHLGIAGYEYRSVFLIVEFIVEASIRRKMLFVRVYVCAYWYVYRYRYNKYLQKNKEDKHVFISPPFLPPQSMCDVNQPPAPPLTNVRFTHNSRTPPPPDPATGSHQRTLHTSTSVRARRQALCTTPCRRNWQTIICSS